MKSRAGASSSTASPTRILVVDDHAQARESMSFILRQAGHNVEAVSSAIEALRLLDRESFDVVLTDLQMPGMNGLEFIRQLDKRQDGAQVVMVTAFASVASAVEAMRFGAFDYIEKPFDAPRLEELINRAVARGRALDSTGGRRTSSGHNPVMIGNSKPMQMLRSRIAQIAPTGETVLITGESGTGKELVARAVHAASKRAAAPLVSLNCPVLSSSLTESELYGHERGAFTGAESPRAGRFELADGGTILLDEITEIDLVQQAKLLRVMQERSFERVGSSTTIHVDVRILATSNRDLPAEVRGGRFREDLFYRLAVLPIEVTPLRQRREDVLMLAEHFLAASSERLSRPSCDLSPSASQLLMDYDWPGNVRELENIITRACVLNQGEPISADEIRPWLIRADGTPVGTREQTVPLGMNLEQMERKLIEATLEHFDGHRARTAQALGIGIRTLAGKLKTYGYAPRAKAMPPCAA